MSVSKRGKKFHKEINAPGRTIKGFNPKAFMPGGGAKSGWETEVHGMPPASTRPLHPPGQSA